MNVAGGKGQRGAALIALLALLMLGASWMLLSRLNAASGDFLATKRMRNAQVLNQAKQALIGYVAAQAAKTGENNPGSLPCPENPGDFDSTTGRQGLIGTACGTTVKVGRFPWRTLGLDQLVDADGESLWYVVSPNWGLNIGSNTNINSNTAGQLTVDGVPNAAVALIIAPGPAIAPAASPGCAAWSQVRPATGTPDKRNYLECENATTPADAVFVTSGPDGSYNDQVLAVTAADVLSAIEAAIAYRIEQEIVPLLRNVYIAPNWGLAGGDRVFPFAALFANPEDPANTFSGTAGTLQGLLPFTYQNCTAGSNPRCVPDFVSWLDWSTTQPSLSASGAGVTFSSTCSYASATGAATCTGSYVGGAPTFTMNGIQRNVGMSLRQVTPGATASVTYNDPNAGGTSGSTTSLLALALNTSGTLTVSTNVSLSAPLGASAVAYTITLPGNVTSDHVLFDATTSSSTGWFVRNGWHKLVYYAIAPGYAASASAPRACSDSGSVTCLQVANLTDPTKQRAILTLAGRSLSGQATRGPSATVALQDYLDSTENRNGDTIFEQLKVGRSFNDRIISISKN